MIGFLRATSVAFFFALSSAALAQNNGTVTNHALPIGKGAGVQGFGSLSLGSGQIPMGQSSADPTAVTPAGDVTIGLTGTTAIGANKVTNAQLRQSGALALVGRSANTTGNVADIQATAGSSCAFVETSSTIACAQLQTSGLANNAVTNAKMATMPALTIKGNATAGTAAPTDIDITALTSKPSPISGDIVLIQDSAASNAFKKTTVGALASAGSVGSYNGRTGAVVAAGNDVPIRSYLAGLILSTAGSSSTFNVSAGVATDSSNVSMMALASAFSKTTSAWSVGTGNGGLDTGTIATSTWYHVYLMQRPDTGVVDICISITVGACTTGGNIPAAYTLFRRIGSMLTDGSSLWVAFTQYGNKFVFNSSSINISSATPPTALSSITVTTPAGVICAALIRSVINAGTVRIAFFNANEVDQGIGSGGIVNLGASGGNAGASAEVMTSTASQIKVKADAASGSYSVQTYGWIDTRGRDT